MPNPTLDEMYRDLDEADRMGDAELAKSIAGRISVAEGASEARAREQTFKTGFKALGPGVLEGIKRLGEGFLQLGTAIAEIGPRGVPMIDPGSTAEMTRQMNARRLAATGGDPNIEQAADLTETGLSMIPAGRMGKAALGLAKPLEEQLVRQAAARAAAGGATGAALATGASETAQSPQDVINERLVAGFLGGTLVGAPAMVAGTRAGIHNMITRSLQRAQQNEASLRELQNAWDLGNPMTVGMRTGNELVKAIEGKVRATAARNYVNKLLEDFGQRAEAYADDFRQYSTSRNPSDQETVQRISTAWNRDRSALQGAASRLYGERLSGAVKLADADPQLFAVPFSNLQRVTGEWAQATNQPWWRRVAPGAERLTGDLARLDNYMTTIGEEAGRTRLDVREIILMRRNLRDLDAGYYAALGTKGGPSPDQLSQHRALNELVEALDQDIAGFRAANPPDRPAGRALAEFVDANEEYTTFKRTQQATDKTAVGQMFGWDRVPNDPEKAVDYLLNMEPQSQRALMNTLRRTQAGQEAIVDLRTGMANRALRAALNAPGRAATEGRISADAWAKSVTNKYGLLGSEVLTPAQRAQMERGLSTVRLLRDASEGPAAVERAAQPMNVTMAAASRSAAFLSRVMYQLLGARHAERLFFSADGLRALETLRDTRAPVTRESTAALAKLLSISGVTGEQPDPESEQQ